MTEFVSRIPAILIEKKGLFRGELPHLGHHLAGSGVGIIGGSRAFGH